MLQPAVDITTSVHKFETILYQFKRDNLNEVDQSHYQKIMGLWSTSFKLSLLNW